MNEDYDKPTLAGYVLWTALVILILALAHHCGALSNIEHKNPSEGSNIPTEVHP